MQVHRFVVTFAGCLWVFAGCGSDSTTATSSSATLPQTTETGTSGDATAGSTAGSTGTSAGATEGTTGTTGTTGTVGSTDTSSTDSMSESNSDNPSTGEPSTGTSDSDTGIGDDCVCAPGTDQIYVLSDDNELWVFDPLTLNFTLVAHLKSDLGCVGVDSTYSLAVDHEGIAWVLYTEPRVLRTADPMEPGSCQDPGVNLAGYGHDLFGMGFANNSEEDDCEKLYLHSYSGEGPFSEGDGVGDLGVVDPQTLEASAISPLNYDGGELAGTGDGRLFAFAGVDPVKLIEYDKLTGEVIFTLPLDSIQKTNASAFAFYGGDFYLFTESLPVGCDECLAENCGEATEACLQDPECAEQLECVQITGEFTDECGGGLPQELHTCLETCVEPCFPANSEKVSQVIHVDYDNSDGPGMQRTVVVEAGPIRVVGASSSTCVPVDPPQ